MSSDSQTGQGACAIMANGFVQHVNGRKVPAMVWSPAGVEGNRPLVLVGHGGTGHKASQLVLDIVAPLVGQHGFHVAAIDGPVHGARRAVFADGDAVREEFRQAWARGNTIDPMIEDWRATIDALCVMPGVDRDALGWYGISMGTAYGLPLVACEPRIRAAVFGMWGTSRPGTERLVADAPRLRCPVLFQEKTEDELFTHAGQLELYAAIGSRRKQYRAYPGGHVNPAGEQLRDIELFLIDELAAVADDQN